MTATYTAFQISRALGCTPQSIRKALRLCPTVRMAPCDATGFQEAVSWSLDSLPDAMKAKLVRLYIERGYRSVHHMLSEGDSKFSCSVPLEKLAPEVLQSAVNLKAHLLPILRKAEHLSIHEMARRAHLSIAQGGNFHLESPRNLRRRIERILERNKGRTDFDNLDLYAEEFAKAALPGKPCETRFELACPNIADAITEYDASQTEFSTARIFEAARLDYETLRARNGQRQAKASILDALAAASVLPSSSRDALRKQIDAIFARMDAGLAGVALLRPPTLKNRGRKAVEPLNPEELRIARGFYVQTGSVTLSLRMLAEQSACRQQIADCILNKRHSKHSIPPSLRAQVAAIPRAVAEFHKSPTKVKRESFITPRTLTFQDKAGAEQRILPGMLSERDDMSNNFIFWIDWPWGGDPCSDKWGCRIARGQNLLQVDAGSLRFLSFVMLVRLRDSYRADDIWQWVGQSYRDHGLPQIGERWERGIWKANKLHGTPIEEGHTDQVTRLGGINALGRKIITSHSPTTKIIENRFRFFQRVSSTIPGQIGAKRGEMERVNKLWTQCREGYRNPKDYFLKYEDVCDQVASKLLYVNSEKVEGAIYNGIPNDIWRTEGGDERMTRLSPEQAYLFNRDRTMVTVNKGHALVRKTAPDGHRHAWYFHHPELWRHDGEQVALYFDKFAPKEGATIVHTDKKRANQVIGHAALVDGCPQFALGLDLEAKRGSEAALAGLDRRKDFNAAVRAEYRALGLTHTIAKGTYASDGSGSSCQVDQAKREPAQFRTAQSESVIQKSRIERLSQEAPSLAEIELLEAEMIKREGILIP